MAKKKPTSRGNKNSKKRPGKPAKRKKAPPPKKRQPPVKAVRDEFWDDLVDSFEDEFDDEDIWDDDYEDEDYTPELAAIYLSEDALDTENLEHRRRFARAALELDPNCQHAYQILIDASSDLDLADEGLIDLCRRAVAAGEHNLGLERVEHDLTQIWDTFETKAYLHSRLRLANGLWLSSQHDEAIAHLCGILRVLPSDELGARYVLASHLLTLGRDIELSELIAKFDEDDSADWAYDRAILAFRAEGDTPAVCGLLEQAEKRNRHVPDFLAGHRDFPMEIPDTYESGSVEEAVCYAVPNLAGWKTTPGAIPWLRRTLNLDLPGNAERPPVSWKQLCPKLCDLAISENETWQVVVSELPPPPDADNSEISCLWLVTCPATESTLEHDVLGELPTAEDMLVMLAELMLHPTESDPRRPQRIEMRANPNAEELEAKLKEIDVEYAITDRLDYADDVLEELAGAIRRHEELTQVPLPSVDELAGLPQELEEVWQVDGRPVATWVHDQGDPQRPWIILVTNRTHDLVFANDMTMSEPDPDQVWRTMALAMIRPHIGESHRPSKIELCSPRLHKALAARLQQIEVQCSLLDQLDHLDFVCNDLSQHLAQDKGAPTALIDVPGMTLEMVGDYFDAAAYFFRKAPWRKVQGDRGIKIECPKFQTHTWYGVVMGQSGVAMGLSLNNDLNALNALLESGDDPRETAARQMTSLSLIYGEAFDMAPRDIDAAERYGWDVATSEAFPMATWLNPGFSVRTPLAWELELLTVCLRTIPDFLSAKSSQPMQVSVKNEQEEFVVTLSWA